MFIQNSKLSLGFCAILALGVLSGCSDRRNISPFPTISREAHADLKRPVDCSTAHEDIATLEDEKASVGKQILSGVRSILPISAVAGILMGDYRDRTSVAIGTYNDEINNKIDQIRRVCNIK